MVFPRTWCTWLGSSTDLDPAVVRQFFRIIEEQADHMHGLVAELLDVARIETGTLPVSPEPAEVAALVDRARSTFISAGGRNNLVIEIEPDLPLVMADRLRIVQVTWFTYTGTSGEMDVWGPYPHSTVVTLGPYLGSGWQVDGLLTLDYTNFLPQFDIRNSKRHQSFVRSGQYDWIEHHCASTGYYWGSVGGTGWYYGSRCLGCRIGYHIVLSFP